MAGLLNSQPGAAPEAPAAGGATQSQEIADPILKQVEDGIEAAVPDKIREGYNQIVNAGMAFMYSPETTDLMMQQLEASDDIVANVSDGIAKLIVLISQGAKGKMQREAAGPAAISLMAQALDFWEKTGGGEVTEQIVADATMQTIRKTMEKLGIKGEQLDQIAAAGQQAQAGGAGPAAQGGAQPQQMGV